MPIIPIRARLDVDEQSSVARVDIFDFIDPTFGFGVEDLVERITAAETVRRIELRIHSQGGDALEGFAIYGILLRHPAVVVAEVVGIAGSAASVIVMAADKITINPSGFVTIHLPFMPHVSGNAAALRQRADLLDDLLPAFILAYQRHSSLSAEELEAAMSARNGEGTMFRGADAVEAGLAHEVMDDAPQVQNRIDVSQLADVPDDVVEFLTGTAPQEPEVSSTLLQECLATLRASPRLSSQDSTIYDGDAYGRSQALLEGLSQELANG